MTAPPTRLVALAPTRLTQGEIITIGSGLFWLMAMLLAPDSVRKLNSSKPMLAFAPPHVWETLFLASLLAQAVGIWVGGPWRAVSQVAPMVTWFLLGLVASRVTFFFPPGGVYFVIAGSCLYTVLVTLRSHIQVEWVRQ